MLMLCLRASENQPLRQKDNSLQITPAKKGGKNVYKFRLQANLFCQRQETED